MFIMLGLLCTLAGGLGVGVEIEFEFEFGADIGIGANFGLFWLIDRINAGF